MKFKIGDKVKKITGDYLFAGTVVAAFQTISEADRFVVEHDSSHMLHIFAEKNLDYLEGSEFEECDTCRKKSGSPALCYGCLHNRLVIERLKKL
jgi:hypothetical protein